VDRLGVCQVATVRDCHVPLTILLDPYPDEARRNLPLCNGSGKRCVRGSRDEQLQNLFYTL